MKKDSLTLSKAFTPDSFFFVFCFLNLTGHRGVYVNKVVKTLMRLLIHLQKESLVLKYPKTSMDRSHH